jgi:hypothetical protein
VTAAEGDNSHVMQASTQEDEDTSNSHQHLKSDTVTQPTTTETEIVQPALTQPSHILESEEVIAVPQLPEKVMPETPQPPASSDIRAIFQQLLGRQDRQEGHNQTVANFMGAQLSHNDKQQSFNNEQQSFNKKQQSFNDDQKTFNMNLQAFSTKQQSFNDKHQNFNDDQEVFNNRFNQFV